MYLTVGSKDPINKVLWNEANAVKATAGGTLTTSELPTGTTYVEKGCPVKLNYTTGAVNVSKCAKLYANAANNATTYQVLKGHLFKVGDVISTFDVASTKGYAITAIDTTTNATHDVLSVGTTLGTAMTAANGVYLVEIAAEDTSGGAGVLKYIPNGLLATNVKVEGSPSCTPVIQALEIQTANLPYYVAPLQVTKLNVSQTFMFV